MSHPVVELGDAEFDLQVMQSSAGLVVVEFSDAVKVNARGTENTSARMDRVIDELAASDAYPGFKFFRVSIEMDTTRVPVVVTRNAISAARFDILHAPTTVFLKHGRQVGSQIVGYYLEDELKSSIENAQVTGAGPV